MRPNAAASAATPGKRRRAMEQQETQGNDVQDAAQTTQLRVNGNGIAAGDKADDVERAQAEAAEDDGEESEEEEEALVVLELCDFKNHPLLDDYSSATLEGIDTATPMLRIGEYMLHGQLEETVGTSYFYDTDTSRVPDKTYRFAGQTIKKIKFTIAPPEDD